MNCMCGITNRHLYTSGATAKDFLKLGFIEKSDGSGQPEGTWWNLKTRNFEIDIDYTLVVSVARLNMDSDPIKVIVDDLAALGALVDWAGDSE